jgi:hypothetical protein
MQAAYKMLRPRWQIVYRTRYQMIGAKPVSEIAGPSPGAQFVYGTVELPALEPAYVEHGRRRPKAGPLVEALDRFIAEKVRDVAQQISAKRKQKLDERTLDEVHEENRKLNEFKNRFLPTYQDGGPGPGPLPPRPPGPERERGTVPEALEYSLPDGDVLHVGKGVTVALRSVLGVGVRDANGRPVNSSLDWFTSDHHVADIFRDGRLEAKDKGNCEIWLRVRGTEIESKRISVQVWNVDHVLLTPRTIDIPLGKRQQILAEVTDDEGRRSTDVLLDWSPRGPYHGKSDRKNGCESRGRGCSGTNSSGG